MMDHPNIAKVLDAGATDAGRPYFAMELVRGIPITRYCDQEKINTRQRVELFIKACNAIQHAHQKGVIHRDIKPSNILVTLHDGAPVPKVIDFGIAKATQQDLTDKTLYTQLQQFIGTPVYMSPEQAEMSGLDIDTRSDIYSLGVLLYELLTGKTPFDAEELMKAGIDGMRKAIREREPLRPSTRVATLQGEELTTTAARHAAEAPKLISLLRGDLDWVVMKCLEKDRSRRYETANALAMDLQRHLNNEPVAARPPSRSYRLAKTIRRNKLLFAAAGAVAAALLLGVILSTWQALRARRAEALALQTRNDSEQLSNFILDDFYEELQPSGQFETVARLARQALTYYDNLPPTLRTSDTARNRAMAQARLALVNAEQGNLESSHEMAQEAATTMMQMYQRGDRSEATIYALGLAIEAEFTGQSPIGWSQLQLQPLEQGIQILRPFALSTDGSRRIKLLYADLRIRVTIAQPPEQQLATYEDALSVLSGLGALELKDLTAASIWAGIADSEARVEARLGRFDDAERTEKQVQLLADGVIARRPADLRARVDRIQAFDLLSRLESARYHDDTALQLATAARQAVEDYIQFNPSDRSGWARLGATSETVCGLLLHEGRIAEALQKARNDLQESRDPRSTIPGVPGLSSFVATWEAQRGDRAAADRALQECSRSAMVRESRGAASQFLGKIWSEALDARERSVRLAFNENETVYAMAAKALSRLDEMRASVTASPSVGSDLTAPALIVFQRWTLDQMAQSALKLNRCPDAESAARAWLALPRANGLALNLFVFDQPEDDVWGQVLLAHAMIAQGRDAEALKAIEPAVARYRQMQAQGASYVTFRQRFARALYVQALIQSAGSSGTASAHASLDEAVKVLEGLSEEARQLHDSKELLAWIEAQRAQIR